MGETDFKTIASRCVHAASEYCANEGRKHHRPLKYTPEELADMWDRFLDYIKENKYQRKELIKSGERAGTEIHMNIERAMNVEEWCIFSSLSYKTWNTYLKKRSTITNNHSDEEKEMYGRLEDTAKAIAMCMTAQKLQGVQQFTYNAIALNGSNMQDDDMEGEVSVGRTVFFSDDSD